MKYGKQPTRGLIYMENLKVNFSLKTTSLHSGVVEKNKSIMKNGHKRMATFIYIHK